MAKLPYGESSIGELTDWPLLPVTPVEDEMIKLKNTCAII